MKVFFSDILIALIMDDELEYNSNDTTFFDFNCSINANFSISNHSCGNIQQEGKIF